GKLDGGVLGKISLQNHFAGNAAPPSASGNLREQLKRSLGSTKIGEPQRKVRAHYSNQRHAVHVVALGDHLCAYQQINLPGMKSAQHPLEIAATADRVAV